MRKFVSRLLLIAIIAMAVCCTMVFGADTAATTTAVATTTTQSVTFLSWCQAHTAAIFGIALAISEFLAMIPSLSGNGILDAIIKALKVLLGKSE